MPGLFGLPGSPGVGDVGLEPHASAVTAVAVTANSAARIRTGVAGETGMARERSYSASGQVGQGTGRRRREDRADGRKGKSAKLEWRYGSKA